MSTAYRIETPRTRLRCFAPSDHALLTRAVTESVEHLRRWLPWAQHEPVTDQHRLDWLRTQRGQFDLDGDYAFGVFTKDEQAILGSALLRLHADVSEREVGFWIHAREVRRGLASEVTSALVRCAFEIEGLDAVELRCVPDNEPSARIARRLGFAGPTLDLLGHSTPEGKSDLHVYTLSRVEYASSIARDLPIEAYDVLDRRLL